MKKVNSILIGVIALLLCSALNCESGIECIPVKFTNSSSETIYFVNLNGDTSFDESIFDQDYNSVILMNETLEVTTICPSPLDRNHICYVFKESTLKTHSKEEIIEKKIYDQKYELKYNELEAKDFSINYTGD